MYKNDLQKFQKLPIGWQKTKLGEVLPILYGKGLPEKIRDINGKFPVYGSSGQVGLHSEPLTKKPTLIIGRKGSVGEIYYSNLPCWPIDTTYFAEENELINLHFFKYLLKGLNLAKLDKSTAIPGLSRDDYNEIEVAVAPLGEQKRIVAEIEKQFSRLDEAVEGLKRVKANLKRYKASVLKAAVEGKLTEKWRKANPDVEPADKLLERILTEHRKKWEETEYAKMKASGKLAKDCGWKRKYQGVLRTSNEGILKLPSLPQGWSYLHMGELIEELKYGTSKKCGYETGDVGVLRIPNIIDGVISDKDIKFAEFDKKECETYKLRDGDILIIPSNGSVSLVGKCAMVTKSDEKYLYAGYLIKIRPLPNIVSSKYLAICLSSLLVRKQIESKAKSTSGVNNINTAELQSLLIPLCGLEEQKEIAEAVYERLSVIEHLNADIDDHLSRADRLRQSILKKAFSGQLVPQDADDEPVAQMAI
jgi:type I restriction enzyme, S subunit